MAGVLLYHIHGKITLEYTPLWMGLGVLAERYIYAPMFRFKIECD